MTFSADMREVWKRLGASEFLVAKYADNGALAMERVWGKHGKRPETARVLGLDFPVIEVVYGSAMQGCKL